MEVLELSTSGVSEPAYHFESCISSEALVDFIVNLLVMANQMNLRMRVIVVVVVHLAACFLREIPESGGIQSKRMEPELV